MGFFLTRNCIGRGTFEARVNKIRARFLLYSVDLNTLYTQCIAIIKAMCSYLVLDLIYKEPFSSLTIWCHLSCPSGRHDSDSIKSWNATIARFLNGFPTNSSRNRLISTNKQTKPRFRRQLVRESFKCPDQLNVSIFTRRAISVRVHVKRLHLMSACRSKNLPFKAPSLSLWFNCVVDWNIVEGNVTLRSRGGPSSRCFQPMRTRGWNARNSSCIDHGGVREPAIMAMTSFIARFSIPLQWLQWKTKGDEAHMLMWYFVFLYPLYLHL